MATTYNINAHFLKGDSSRFVIHQWPTHAVLRIGNVDMYFHGTQANLLEDAMPDIWLNRVVMQPAEEEALA